jgi:prepilin-type processing-associated H-X9-DG protein
LIELLVVIAIIAILAAILFPVFSRAREKARQTQCLSNMKQLAMALMMYLQDWDERFPGIGNHGYGYGPEANNPYALPHGKIYPYVKNVGVYDCPSADMFICKVISNGCARDALPGNGWGYPFPPDFYGHSIDIGYNWLLGGDAWVNPPRTLASLPTPSETVAFADSSVPHSTCGGRRVVYANVCGAACNPPRRLRSNTRHNEGENLIFCDGHVKWMNHRQIGDNCGKLFDPARQHDNLTWWGKWGPPAD